MGKGNACLSRCGLQNGFSKSISFLKFCLEVPYQLVSDTNRKPKEPPKPVMMQTRSITVLQTQTDDDFKKIFLLEGKLGEGSFGTVFLCVEKATGKEYACKSVEKRKLIRGEDVENLRNEINIMHYLAGHPNVASIKGSYEDSEAVHIVMELCRGGELFDRIKQRRHYEERDAARLTRTIAAAVHSFHSLGVMHRDLKPENFLFLNQEEDSPLKVIDFGLSTFFSPGERFSTPVGSIYYAAPEVLQKKCGPEADIWSAGVILYILLSGVFPFRTETNEARHKQVLHDDLDFSSGPWPGISETAKDLIRRMHDPDPATRITAREILSHPWFKVCGVESLDSQ